MSPELRVQIVTKPGSGRTGTGRYTAELCRGLAAEGIDVQTAAPVPPLGSLSPLVKRMGIDLPTFFASYPVRAPLAHDRLIHIPTQTMATLLRFSRTKQPTVVTVLDIIPYLVRKNLALNTFRHRLDECFYRGALSSLKQASAIIAISEYTKSTLIETLGLPANRISVTPLGVDSDVFRPQSVANEFLDHYGLHSGRLYVLVVGSEDPRKNLPALFRALAIARQRLPDLELVKVGAAHHGGERLRLHALAEELGIAQAVHFLDHVPDADLPSLYCTARLLAMPSLYEGFGLPVLEAMACGVQVVIANRTSLPEVGGPLALAVNPEDVYELADALVMTANQPSATPHALREHALRFTWRATVQTTLSVYRSVWAS
ncbi:MAG TPA: glycosyltransferase family 1 protein [Candidatus Limnocylindrales bacterium]|nr:glycosyltransferase family 1 protein [Candidatus Limnocylindrales bacterium]